MIPSLQQLGLISAIYADEEAKQQLSSATLPAQVSSVGNSTQKPSPDKSSTVVSAPMPSVAALQKAALKNSFASASSSSSSSASFLTSSSSSSSSSPSSSLSSSSVPPSPVLSTSPPNSGADYALPAVMLPFLTQGAPLPAADKLQQLQLGLLQLGTQYQSVVPSPQRVLVQTPFGLTSIPALSAASFLAGNAAPYVPPPPAPPAQPQVAVLSSLQSARLRKPFHKRRPAHMDKSMLFCHFCGRKDTPEWRKGPAGPATLCNACGLQWAKKVRAQRSSTSSRSSTTTTSQDVPESVATTSEVASTAAKEVASDASKLEDATTA